LIEELQSRSASELSADEYAIAYGDQVKLRAEAFGLSFEDALGGMRMQEAMGAFWEYARSVDPLFGGGWIEWQPSPRFVVGVAESRRSDAREQQPTADLVAEAKRANLPVEFVAVEFTFAELQDAAAEVARQFTGNVSVSVDERRQSIVVAGASADDEAKGAVTGVGVPVLFESVGSKISPDSEVPGGWSAIGQYTQCTMGFGVVAPAATLGSGDTRSGLATAGHCLDNGPQYSGPGYTVNLQNVPAAWDRNCKDKLPRTAEEEWFCNNGVDTQVFPISATGPDDSSNRLAVPNTTITRNVLTRLPQGYTFSLYGAAGAANCTGRAEVNLYFVQGYTSEGRVKSQAVNQMGVAGGLETMPGDSGGPAFTANYAVGQLWGSDNILSCADAGSSYISRMDAQLLKTPMFLREGPSTNNLFDGVGTYHPITPTRVADTRPSSAVGPNGDLVVAAPATVLNDASAIVATVTSVPVSGSGNVIGFPNNISFPVPTETVLVSYTSGVSNGTGVVRLGDNSQIRLRNTGSGTTHLIVDVVGYYSRATGTQPLGNGTVYRDLDPLRIYDSRPSNPLGAGQNRIVTVVGQSGGIPALASSKVAVLSIAAISPTATTFLVAYPAGTTKPAVSSLNAAPGDVVNRLVMVPIGALGSISVFNQSGSVHFTVDVIGYFETTCCGGQGGRTEFSNAKRIYATAPFVNSLNPGESRTVRVIGPNFDVGPVDGVGAAILNVTTYGANGNGWVVAHPNLSAVPNVATVNYGANEVETNTTIVRMVPSFGEFAAQHITITNGGTSTVNVVIDLVGWVRE
jgi:hypothetical protein